MFSYEPHTGSIAIFLIMVTTGFLRVFFMIRKDILSCETSWNFTFRSSMKSSWSTNVQIRPVLELLLNRFVVDVSDDKIACMALWETTDWGDGLLITIRFMEMLSVQKHGQFILIIIFTMLNNVFRLVASFWSSTKEFQNRKSRLSIQPNVCNYYLSCQQGRPIL